MGTKTDPGAYDCYANAKPDEPMFVLLGRDRHAAVLVNLWAYMRKAAGESPAKVAEAHDTANAMVEYRNRLKPGEIPAGVRAAIEALVALAQDVGCVVTVDRVPVAPLTMTEFQHRVQVRSASRAGGTA
jgi:hypothetical protein